MNLDSVRHSVSVTFGHDRMTTASAQIAEGYANMPEMLRTLTDADKRHILESAIMDYVLGSASEWSHVGFIARQQSARSNRITL